MQHDMLNAYKIVIADLTAKADQAVMRDRNATRLVRIQATVRVQALEDVRAFLLGEVGLDPLGDDLSCLREKEAADGPA